MGGRFPIARRGGKDSDRRRWFGWLLELISYYFRIWIGQFFSAAFRFRISGILIEDFQPSGCYFSGPETSVASHLHLQYLWNSSPTDFALFVLVVFCFLLRLWILCSGWHLVPSEFNNGGGRYCCYCRQKSYWSDCAVAGFLLNRKTHFT